MCKGTGLSLFIINRRDLELKASYKQLVVTLFTFDHLHMWSVVLGSCKYMSHYKVNKIVLIVKLKSRSILGPFPGLGDNTKFATNQPTTNTTSLEGESERDNKRGLGWDGYGIGLFHST